MGESFKLHAQALIGYEDSMMVEQATGSPQPLPAPPPQHPPEVAAY